MPFKGFIKTGDNYTITINSDPATPGTTAVAIGWVPLVNGSPSLPTIVTIAPGMNSVQSGIVPPSQLLQLDFDLPNQPASKITVDVNDNGQSVANGNETEDSEWTFVVVPS